MAKAAKKTRGALAAVRSRLEETIVLLAAERTRIDSELRVLTAAFNLLEQPVGKVNGGGKAPKTGVAEQVAHYLNKKDEVTTSEVAKHLGISPTYASTMLARIGKRVRMGVYTAKGRR